MAKRKIGEDYNENRVLEIGQSCEGFFLGSHASESESGDTITFYSFEGQDGKKFDILGNSVLKNKMSQVKTGEYVFITYVDDKKSKKRKGKIFKLYSVEVDDDVKKN